MMFQPYFMVLTPLNPFLPDQNQQYFEVYAKNQLLADHNPPETEIKTGQQSEKPFNSAFCQIVHRIKDNSNKTNEIITLLDRLYKGLNVPESHQKESSLQTHMQESESVGRAGDHKVDNNRTHPKVKLMQKVFGKREYAYKLAYDGKFPKILFKQRNISVRVLLKNLLGENVINGNKISLNLKVYKNNGEQIVSEGLDHSFMDGICQTQIKSGVGTFSKIHPRQVSRGFSGKGVCIIIYATSQQNQANEQGLIILASQIKPLIFYNVKVVVKQNKLKLKNRKYTALESDESN